MRIRGTILVALIGTVAVLAQPAPARAALLSFDFSFTGPEGGPGASGDGTVTGVLTGLQDNTANQPVVDIEYDSYPEPFMSGIGTPPVSFPASGNAFTNEVTVVNGQITSIQIDGLAISPFVSFDFDNGLTVLNDLADSTSISTGSTATYTEVGGSSPVPEPASMAILGFGLMGVASVRRRRATRHAAGAALA